MYFSTIFTSSLIAFAAAAPLDLANSAAPQPASSVACAAASSISLVSSAAPSASATAPVIDNAYNFISARSGDINVHLRPLYAKNSAIRIGGTAPTSQTPKIPALAGFPSTSVATFFVLGGRASLDVVVPGGQQVYVGSDGRLSYTVPHSGNTGIGSTVTGFSVVPLGSNITLKFNDKAGFLACPARSAGAVAGEYDIYAAELTSRTDCTDISVLGSANTNPPTAWQW